MTMLPAFTVLTQPVANTVSDGYPLDASRSGDVRAVALSPSVYRRRRFVAAAAVFLLTVVSVIGVGQASAERQFDPAAPQHTVIIVQPGDTLWGIAQRLAPDADTRKTVAQLTEIAGDPNLEVGQRLLIPASVG
ncbi:MAG: LysM peptidoglycan-binding domain-containing protein [Acidimicrobiales bacterium]